MRIDVRPGDDGNEINLRSQGKVPVAVLGADDFDPSQIDLMTVLFAGAPVCVKPNGRFMSSWEDVNDDGHQDLVLHFEVQEMTLHAGDEEATLVARLFDGTEHACADRVTVLDPGGEVVFHGRQHVQHPHDASATWLGSGFGIRSVSAGSAAGTARLSFTLAGDGRAVLDVFAVNGRKIGSRDLGDLGAGAHEIEVGRDFPLTRGVYFFRLREGENAETVRLPVLTR